MELMKRKYQLSLIAAAMLSASSVELQAQTQFDQVIVFGASFLDSGTFLDFGTGNTSGLRFTNIDPDTGIRGSALSEILTADLGLGSLLPATPLPIALIGTAGERTDGTDDTIDRFDNINFAVGGFQTDNILESIVGESVPGSAVPGFNQRIDLNVLSVSDNALFLVNLGGNDIRAFADPFTTADTTLTILQELVNSGARTIIAPNLPRLGEFAEAENVNPDGSRTAIALGRTAGAEAFNSFVDDGLSSIDANIIRVDNLALFDEILATPETFGFSGDVNQNSECFDSISAPLTTGGAGCTENALLGISSGGNPDDFIFNDGLHPTQRTAQISADYIESLLRAPGQISLISESGYLALAQHQSSIRSQLAELRYSNQEIKSYRFFSNIDSSSDDIDQSNSSLSAENDSTTGNIGFAYKYDAHWTLGLALGYVDQDVDVDSTGTSFENDGFLISALAAYQKGKLFAEATITYADIDIESDRGVELGVAQRIESGDTDGNGLGITVAAGYDLLNSKKWRAGPILRLDYNLFDVDSFSEQGNRSTSLSFQNIERDSLITSLGAFANLQSAWGSIPVQYFGELSIEADLANGSDNVQVSLNSLSNAPSFELDGIDNDSVGFTTQLGVSATLAKNITAQVSYNYRDIGGSLNAINFGLNVGF